MRFHKTLTGDHAVGRPRRIGERTARGTGFEGLDPVTLVAEPRRRGRSRRRRSRGACGFDSDDAPRLPSRSAEVAPAMLDRLLHPTVALDDADAPARAWAEDVELPTYPHGEPLPHPMFLDKRVYQGSSGRVYPLPVIDRVGERRTLRAYRAVFLENRWLKVMLLPDLGGRVHMAYDKQHDHHFVYFNRVVKPALVGLAGPWISGGIEFNWPQHHRPSTFLPIGWHLEATASDGAAACVLAETDRMHGTRMVARFSLAADHAALRVDVTLSNPTEQPQTFLWWANPAVAANRDYQAVFPPDVRAVLDHGKRDVSEFPIARGVYYKVDYGRGPEPADAQGRGGTDISRYRNIPVPTSYMAYRSDFDFMGGYDHGRRMGLLHVADHHRVPGKKQWTWGHGDFGRAWDRELTDEDGPYVELMVGAYTDNQPDFSWLEPGEEKRFTQHFMPYREVGMVKNADTDLQLGLEPAAAGAVRVAVGVSRVLGPLEAKLVDVTTGEVLWAGALHGEPGVTLVDQVAVGDVPMGHLRLSVADAQGVERLAFQPDSWPELPVPAPARPVGAPASLPTVEQCYLAGLHLEQYRHASREPSCYYREGLRRDPGDLRCNNALGLLLLRRGDFAAAEPLFRAALARQTEHNGNPYDGEPFYNLGQCLLHRARPQPDRLDEAEAAFHKAAWNAAFQARGLAGAARVALRRDRPMRALQLLDEALHVEPRNALARSLRLAATLALVTGQANRADAERRGGAGPAAGGAGGPRPPPTPSGGRPRPPTRCSRRTRSTCWPRSCCTGWGDPGRRRGCAPRSPASRCGCWSSRCRCSRTASWTRRSPRSTCSRSRGRTRSCSTCAPWSATREATLPAPPRRCELPPAARRAAASPTASR
jgi:Tfp pilus assembly protein PilF